MLILRCHDFLLMKINVVLNELNSDRKIVATNLGFVNVNFPHFFHDEKIV